MRVINQIIQHISTPAIIIQRPKSKYCEIKMIVYEKDVHIELNKSIHQKNIHIKIKLVLINRTRRLMSFLFDQSVLSMIMSLIEWEQIFVYHSSSVEIAQYSFPINDLLFSSLLEIIFGNQGENIDSSFNVKISRNCFPIIQIILFHSDHATQIK